MLQMSLVRSAADRNVYELAGVGQLAVAGWLGGDHATFVTNEGVWTCGKLGLMSGALQATAQAGKANGRFDPMFLGTGGRLTWERREYLIRSAGPLSGGYRLSYASTTLCEFRLALLMTGSRPMDITLRSHDISDELLLFGAYVVRSLARTKAKKRRRSAPPFGAM